jgi:hypothetical protein
MTTRAGEELPANCTPLITLRRRPQRPVRPRIGKVLGRRARGRRTLASGVRAAAGQRRQNRQGGDADTNRASRVMLSRRCAIVHAHCRVLVVGYSSSGCEGCAGFAHPPVSAPGFKPHAMPNRSEVHDKVGGADDRRALVGGDPRVGIAVEGRGVERMIDRHFRTELDLR